MDINLLFKLLQHKTGGWKIADDFPDLPCYDDNGTARPFLSTLFLSDLKLPVALSEEEISFHANIEKKSTAFLKELICYDGLPEIITAKCRISVSPSGFIFEAAYECDYDATLQGFIYCDRLYDYQPNAVRHRADSIVYLSDKIRH